MIISRTPFRISFVGGGTDLKSFYTKEAGKVLSTTIDKYIYVAVKRQIGIVEYKYRVNWSKVEFTNTINEIEHPIVREAFRLMEIDFPVEVSTFADIPAGTGLGSSSSFAVGLLNALFALKGEMATKAQLANLAAHIEIDLLKRNIGKQDHYAASYGDLNVFTFEQDGKVSVSPICYRPEVRETIAKNLLLFYTSQKRDANEVLTEQKKKTSEKFNVLKAMKEQVSQLEQILYSGIKLHEFGELLHQGWLLKKSITDKISSATIDDYYDRAMKAGAIGGKLLGAGGGGFLLFYVEPQNQRVVKQSLADLFQLNFNFDDAGTRITYFDQTQF